MSSDIIITVPSLYVLIMKLTVQLAGIKMRYDIIITVPSIYFQWNWLYN